MNKTDGIVNIKGKEYETVASRILKFRKDHEGWGLTTEIIKIDEKYIIMKAAIIDEKDRLMAVGHSEEMRNSSLINKTSALENAETSAWGRALANLGYGGTQIASADEVSNAITQQKTIENQHYCQTQNDCQTQTQTQTRAESEAQPQPSQRQYDASKFPVKLITDKQLQYLKNVLKKKDMNADSFASNYGYNSASEITMNKFNDILLEAKNVHLKQPEQSYDDVPQ